MSIAFLSSQQIREIALYLSQRAVSLLWCINHKCYQAICNNEIFWQQKFYLDYGSNSLIKNPINWKTLYLNFGSIWVCGNNASGQLGVGDEINRNSFVQIPDLKGTPIKQISAGDYHTVILDFRNNIWVCGKNGGGQLGLGDNQPRNVPVKIHSFKSKQLLQVSNCL